MLRLGFTVTCCVEWVVDARNKRMETVYLRTPNYYGVFIIILFGRTYGIWPVVCDGAPDGSHNGACLPVQNPNPPQPPNEHH